MAKKKKAATRVRKKAAKKRRNPRQTYIKGTEPPSIPEIDRASLAYVEARDERMDWGRQEVERKNALAELMKKHDLDKYEHDNLVVSRTHSETDNVSVKVKKAEEAA